MAQQGAGRTVETEADMVYLVISVIDRDGTVTATIKLEPDTAATVLADLTNDPRAGPGVLLNKDDANIRESERKLQPEEGPYKYLLKLGRSAHEEPPDTIALLRRVLREERKVASVALSSMSANHWTLIQQTGRLKLRFVELRLEGNFEDVIAFEWDMKLHEDDQADRYMEHLRTLFGRLHPASNTSYLSWVEGGQKEKNFLTQTGLADRLHFEKIAGNMDAAIVSRTSLRCDDARQGVYLLFELKKEPKRFNVYQARGELLLANLLSPERRPVVILTDLVDDWRLLWLDGHDVCESVFTCRSEAVHVVNQIIAQAELAAGYEATCAPVSALPLQIHGMPQAYNQRQPAPDLLYMDCSPDRMDTDLAELTSLRGLIPDGELRHALAARFMQQACRLPQFAAPPISRAPSSMYV